MTASLRRHPHSPAVLPLDDDDLLSEILLRLPPQPSSLPRASLICKSWRGLVSDPRFLHRFRRHHRRSPPILGSFVEKALSISFVPALDPPNRVPVGRFSLQCDDVGGFSLLNCRHGLVLIFLLKHNQVLVWDPISGDQHRIAVPPSFCVVTGRRTTGAVLRAGGDNHHFQVVLIGTYKEQHPRAIACIYSSETGIWGNLLSTLLPYEARSAYTGMACVLVGNCLYWVLIVEGGVLSFLISSWDFNAQLWNMEKNCDGVVSWVLRTTIELDKLLSLKPDDGGPQLIIGFAEDNIAFFLLTKVGVFMVQLKSLQFKKLSKTNYLSHYHPFESVYTADIGGERDGAELLHNMQDNCLVRHA
ncbi:hypothetical protein CFC21_086765 [Triticum aestivum]|uniref:F-box domain-containing protein n=3 Tax=Triticum TaxID=4564 RepID=A0A9R0YG72_TRITD|nr:hypothetical protein CFC21_086765 [Triticum aestivum]VAI54239.1 unnamed protein product [Triticum turgidum subsp. durum]